MSHLSTTAAWPNPDADSSDEDVFKALADPSRRLLLDSLFVRDGQTLGELSAPLPMMTRFGVMNHLRFLQAAGLEGRLAPPGRPGSLVTRWRFRHDPDMARSPPTPVRWQIEPLDDMCRLTLVHDDFPSETATFKSVGGGWPLVLSSLKSLLET